ncbi:MAG: hypothetical protein JSU06_00915 [Actinobacteria bacterium]|nr:hypothetical protein [Actinomycetota bacterium]
MTDLEAGKSIRGLTEGRGRATDTVEFNPMELYHFARSLTSSVFGSSDPDRDIPMLTALARSGEIDLAPLISHRTDLRGVGDAFARMRAGEGLRTVIEMG